MKMLTNTFLSLLLTLIEISFHMAEVTFPYVVEGEDLVDNKGEKAKLYTDINGKEFPGYSGEGFTYLNGEEYSINLELEEEGIFVMAVVGIQFEDKEKRKVEIITINGQENWREYEYSDVWKSYNFGKIRLHQGNNTITFTNRWGHIAIDKVILSVPDWPDLKEATDVPCDPQATKEVKTLMKYFHSVYGEKIISGQQETYGGGHDGNYEQEFDYIHWRTGKYPAIRGFDICNFNTLYGWDDGTWGRIVKWWEKGGIVTAVDHFTVPTDFENYTLGTPLPWENVTYRPTKSFKVENAPQKGTKENEYLNGNIKIMAEHFLELQEKGIPVIFRPFHEAEGAWFWWGQEGPEAFKNLWIYLFTELTETYGVHNLIWELNLYNNNENSSLWYPGDEYVDIVGYDKYNVVYNRHDGKTSGPNEDAESGLFYGLLNIVKNKKMVSMPENDTIPSVKNLLLEHAYWLYFCTWYDLPGSEYISYDYFQNPETIKEIYNSDLCITLDELPDLKNGEIE